MKKDQRGFTLVELIVAILIMSMVMLAAAGFVVSAANSYRVSNIEIELQMEAQIAVNQFSDILIEAKDYTVVRKADGTMDKLTVTTGEGKTYTFQMNEEKRWLVFSEGSGEEALLAKYCESVKITPDAKPAAGEKQIVTVEIDFLYSGKSYKTTSCISLRN